MRLYSWQLYLTVAFLLVIKITFWFRDSSAVLAVAKIGKNKEVGDGWAWVSNRLICRNLLTPFSRLAPPQSLSIFYLSPCLSPHYLPSDPHPFFFPLLFVLICFCWLHFSCPFLSSLPESDAHSQKTFWAVPWAQPLVQVPHHRQV